MPYKNISELPSSVKDLPQHAKTIFLNAFNSSYEKYGEEGAFKIAWAAVKHKYKKQDDQWVKMEEKSLAFVQIPTFIVKAAIEPTTGRMYWRSTASDTLLDVFDEQMSISLYESFIRRFTGKEFLSLAHYPRLGGLGEVGVIQKIWIDRNQLKTFGYFNDTSLGRLSYRAIRSERRDEVPETRRTRVSIGFWDLMHKHNDFIWQLKSGTPCMQCALGIKNKIYLDGIIDHVALTKIPVNERTNIETED